MFRNHHANFNPRLSSRFPAWTVARYTTVFRLSNLYPSAKRSLAPDGGLAGAQNRDQRSRNGRADDITKIFHLTAAEFWKREN